MKIFFGLVFGLALFGQAADAYALTISPTKIEVSGDPGQTVIGEIELFNEEGEPKTFYTSSENFEPRGETGSPYFVGGGTGLASWITTNSSLNIAPGERVTVPYTIQIPDSASAGGYFAAIFFGSQAPQSTDGGAEVAIGGKVGSILLLRVNGHVEEGGGLVSFNTEPDKLFASHLPLNFVYRLNNTGGDQVIPRGEIVVTNTFGGVVENLLANKNEGSVLPNSTRRFDVSWLGSDNDNEQTSFVSIAASQLHDFHFGLYKAKLSVVWGDSAQLGESTVRILIIPWQLLTFVIGGIFVLVVLLKFYNKMIIARARKHG